MFRADTLATGDVIQLYWSTPDTVEEQHIIWEFYGAGAVQIELLEGVSYTSGGTAFVPFNHNRRSNTTSNCTCKTGSDGVLTDPIVYTGGTQIHFEEIGSGKSLEGKGDHTSEFILKRDEEYLLQLTAVGNNIRCNVQSHWYEHIPHN